MRNRYSPFRWLTRSLWFSAQHNTLLQKMAERIRQSLELDTVLQTTVNEVADLLEVDSCLFCWYNERLKTVEVVCEHLRNSDCSYLGTYTLTEFPDASALIQSRQQVVCPERPSVWWGDSPQAAHSDPGDRPHACLLGARSSLLLPVEGVNGALGFIACLSRRPRRWPLAEQEFMRSISHQIEIAVRQAQLYDTTQRLARREQVVNQITTQTRQSFEIGSILNGAIAQLLDALQVDRCLVYLVAPWQGVPLAEPPRYPSPPPGVEPDSLFEVCRPPFAPAQSFFAVNGPITQWVRQYHQMVVIEDVTADPRIGADNLEYQLAHIQSSLVVPVQAGGVLLAILYLNQCSHLRYWTTDDQALAQAVADQLAVSLQQAALYAQLQQQAVDSKAHAQQMAEALENLQQMQTQLIQSEKLSSLGQMVAGLAHEINNPISFIYGNIPYVEQYARDLLRLIDAFQRQYPDLPDEIRQLVAEVELEFLQQDLPRVLTSMVSGASRIRDIVSTLSSFSQLNYSGSRLLDVHQSLEGTLFVLQNHMSPDVQIVREYGELPALACHPRLINQVFMNLLMNAIDALNQQDATHPRLIRISTTQIYPDGPEQGWVRVAIADTGCGIPKGIQAKIFDPFFTTKPVGKGAGLGLAVCYQTVVHQHHGRLRVVSELNQGTEFIVELPIKPVPAGDRPSGGRSEASSPVSLSRY